MIDNSLIALIINETEYYDQFKKFDNIFLDNKCKAIYDAIINCNTNNKHVISDYLKKTGWLLPEDFIDIYTTPYKTEDYILYVDKTLSAYIRNALVGKSRAWQGQHELSLSDLKAEVKKLFRYDVLDESGIHDINELIQKVVAEISTSAPDCVMSYLPYFDSRGGIEPCDLMVIAARPSRAKTTLALNMIIASMDDKIPTALFSLEMEKNIITKILLAIKAGIEYSDIKLRNIDKLKTSSLAMASQWWYDKKGLLKIIDDGNHIDVIAIKLKELVRKHGIKRAYIDYLELVNYSDKIFKRNEGIGFVVKRLKELCKELKIIIVLIAQMNREYEKDEREPRMSDLAGSMDIEKVADEIIFLDFAKYDNDLIPNVVDLRCWAKKWRNGEQGYFEMKFNRKLRRIT